MGLLRTVMSKLTRGLARTRTALGSGLRSILLGRRLDEQLIRDIEARLLQADVGVRTTHRLVAGLQEAHKTGAMTRGEDVLEYLKRELKKLWPPESRAVRFAESGPTVILVTGVNGAGKTTSIAKLCYSLREQGRSVLLGACDTFRAGAVRQLEIWAERLDVQVVKGQQGGDPAASKATAAAAAAARGVDVLILDTAGRLQTQDPLMRQLAKIRSVVAKRIPGAPHEVLLVLDATAGQNALRQTEEFGRALAPDPGGQGAGSGLTGIFLAKLDGTAKGGIVVAIKEATDVPVKFVGLGETPADVEPFDPDAFVDAMFGD